MRFRFNAQLPFLDTRKYKQQLDQSLRDLLVKSASAWLAAAADAIPVWSGAAESTLKDLAAQVNFALSVTPVNNAPDRRRLGTEEGTGELDVDASKGRYSFTYTTTLAHLIANERGFNARNLKTPTPYNFREKAMKAWEEAIRNADIPNIRVTVKGRIYG